MRGFIAITLGILLLFSCAQQPADSPVVEAPSVVVDTIEGVAAGTLLRTELASEFLPARPLDIWLPSSYDGAQKHNVLYMYDAQMLFDATTTWNGQEWRVDEILDSLITDDVIAPTIVVALYNGGQVHVFMQFSTTDELANYWKEKGAPKDASILLKGSRGIALEALLSLL